MRMEKFDVLCIGHLAKDRIVIGDKVSTATGGAVYYGGMVFLRLGLRVAILTRLSRSDFHHLDELQSAGATIFLVEASETSGIENVYPDPCSDQRVCHPLGFAGAFLPEDLPDLVANLVYAGPIMPGEMDLPFLRAAASHGPLALDVQGILRKRVGDELVVDGWPEAEQGLSLVHYLKADDREAAALTGERDVRRAAEKLASFGPKEVVLTHQGGVVVLAERVYEAPFRPKSMAGRTGRGDTCFAVYLGRRLLGDNPQQATRFAAAVTTLKLERPGPFQGSPDEVHRFLTTLQSRDFAEV